jgi:hypothetical protein
MKWIEVSFGKHKGKTIPQIMWMDSDWAFWAYDQGFVKGQVNEQLRYVCERAKAIRIPENGKGKRFVKYVHDQRGKFATIDVHCDSEIPEWMRVSWNTSDVIDLSYPRRTCAYDKLGNKNMIACAKAILFGDPSFKMTKSRCEEFFEDDSNFVLSGTSGENHVRYQSSQNVSSGSERYKDLGYGILMVL